MSIPAIVRVSDQVNLHNILPDNRDWTDLEGAASFFDVQATEMNRSLRNGSLIVCVIKKAEQIAGYLALERYDTVAALMERMSDGNAAQIIHDQGLRFASSLYLKKEFCGQRIGSNVVTALKQLDSPLKNQVFHMVDDRNSASTALQRKLNMQVVTKIYVPSCLDRILCCYKFGIRATVYKL